MVRQRRYATGPREIQVGDRVALRDPALIGANTGTVQEYDSSGWVRVLWDGSIAQKGTWERASEVVRRPCFMCDNPHSPTKV
jgi:hypothetical protein